MNTLKQILLALLIIIFYSNLNALDLTYETIYQGIATNQTSMESNISGTVFYKLLNTNKIVSDIHYQFGDKAGKFNVAYLKMLLGKADIVIGRQLIAWGTGYNFNPTDIFNSKPIASSFDPTYTKTGRDAISLSYYFNNKIQANFIYASEYKIINNLDSKTNITEEGNIDFGLSTKINLFNFDIELSYSNVSERLYNGIKEQEDEIRGVSFKGSIPYLDWGIWTEIVNYKTQKNFEYVFGLEYIYDRWNSNIEYYHNGFGSTDNSIYDMTLLIKGKTLAKNYIIPSLNYLINEKATVTGFVVKNLDDKSYSIGAVYDYFYNDNVELIFTPFYIEGNNNTEYGMQKQGIGDYGIQFMVKVNF